MTQNFSTKDAAVSFLNMVVSGKIREAYEKYVSPNMRHHNAYFKGDRQSLLVAMEEAHVKFPNKIFKVQRTFGDGDLIAVHSSMQLQADMPVISVVHMFRFENDMIVEMWDVGQEAPKDMPNENGLF